MDYDVSHFDKQFRAFLDATERSRRVAEESRDFADLKQWTHEEVDTLKSRNQAPVVFDYTREQLDYFLGVERDTRMDPKAFPRTKEHEDAADACSDALRYVADNNDFDQIGSEGFENLYVEGIEACIIEVQEKRGEFEVVLRHVPWDRFYYDPHSRRRDFKDAQYMGVVVWLDQAQAKRMWPDKADDIEHRLSGTDVGGAETFDDRPIWTDGKRKRVRVCQHYYLKDGVWHMCYFSGDLVLSEPQPVPFVNEDGEPECPIEAQSAYIDRDNNRYGYIRRHIDPQREVNHRRSKALFLLSARQVMLEEGAVQDEHVFRQELKKPDGLPRVNPGALADKRLQLLETGDMANGQIAMYQDAVQKLNASGANAAMQGDVEGMSGRAIERLQHGGSIQIGPLFDCHRAWKRRIYRQIWNRIRQFWDAPKWIRVTDDENNLKWVGLNQPVTLGQQLQQAAQQGDQMAQQQLQQLVATQDPRLNQVVETQNQVAEIDVDIILDEAPNAINTQEEQFRLMADLVKVYGPEKVPFEAMVELSNLRGKRRVMELVGGDEQQQAMQAQMADMQAQIQQVIQELEIRKRQLENAEVEADIAKTQAETAKTSEEAKQKQLENIIVTAYPDVDTQIVV